MVMLLRTPAFRVSPPLLSTLPLSYTNSSFAVNCRKTPKTNNICLCAQFLSPILSPKSRICNTISFCSPGEATETEKPQQPEIQDIESDVAEEASEEETINDGKADELPTSSITTTLQSYKEALINNDESKVAEIEAFLLSIEDEKNDLEKKIASLIEEKTVEKERVLRISADFDNFRKRTDRERLSLVSNAQGEVLENLLGVLDNFERAKAQIKIETEGEEKINNSYQSIYKQFVEILTSVGVAPVETVGNSFDPSLHEAIMQEESMEYEEGIIIEEYRKGFKLGDRLLRPAMVKVSSGPGPAKTETSEPSTEPEDENASTESQEQTSS
ncbi:hypothetical protein V2J09_000194 [Rumex salicifolius]